MYNAIWECVYGKNFTGKPCAYMLKPGLNQKKAHTDFGEKCINSHYVLKKEHDILDFIQNVVIDENDYKKDDRMEFAQREVVINYPNATEHIFNSIKKSLMFDR